MTDCDCFQFCQKAWLGLHDGRPALGDGTRDDTRMRDVMAQRYEKKRWYVQPTDAMYEEARRLNTPLPQSVTTSWPAAVARPQAAAVDGQMKHSLNQYSQVYNSQSCLCLMRLTQHEIKLK